MAKSRSMSLIMNVYGTDEYAQYNPEKQRCDGQDAVDRNVRVSNNSEP